ncbi:MAG: OmpP1/FadL family transporter [Aquirufa sp.]
MVGEVVAEAVLGEVAGEDHQEDHDKSIYNMKKIFIIPFILMGFVQMGFGQIYSYPNLVKNFSSTYATGTARMQALGGSHSVLGADLSSIAGNPAGLGFYTRSELGISLGLQTAKTSSSYLGQNSSADESQFHIPTFGLVIASEQFEDRDWNGSFGLGYSRQVLFNQPISIVGTNNRSSILDSFIESANAKNATGASLDAEYDSYSNTADSPEAVAYQAYLINPSSTGGKPFNRFEPNLPTKQMGIASNEGAFTQWDFSYGANYLNKFYIGGGLHFGKIVSTSTTNWLEEFVGAKYVNGLNYQEKLTTSGSGLSASIGAIYKVSSSLRVALSFQSPMYFDIMNEKLEGKLSPDVKGIPSYDQYNAPILITNVKPVLLTTNEFSYHMKTPLKLSGGVAYFIGKKGFLSADFEFVNYTGMGVSTSELTLAQNQNFKDKNTNLINKYFQSVVNIKLAAEFRVLPQLSVRGGVAQFGNAYSSTYDPIDRTFTQFSGGIGYKSAEFYIDLAGIYRSGNDAYTPYTLSNAADYGSATLKFSNMQLMVSTGIYF